MSSREQGNPRGDERTTAPAGAYTLEQLSAAADAGTTAGLLLPVDEGETIVFFHLQPLYSEEMDLKLDQGFDAHLRPPFQEKGRDDRQPDPGHAPGDRVRLRRPLPPVLAARLPHQG